MVDLLVLCYHAVSPTWDADLSVTPERLERQLASLVRRGYRGATFSDAVTGPPARRTVVVTFDDAYRSVLDLALPVLERLHLPGTVFVPTGFTDPDVPMAWPGIDGWLGGPHEHELRPMGWEGLRHLAAAGWEIGSHTVSHPRLTELDDRALATELGESKATCEQAMGAPCASIAYPYGDVDVRVLGAARDAGYATGAALPVAFHAARQLEWPRVGVYFADGELRVRLKVSRAIRALRSSETGERLLGALRLRG